MTSQRGALPTLTEVIEINTELLPPALAPAQLPAESVPMEWVAPPQAVSSAALVAQVLELLRPRIDAMLEVRLREALAAQLSRVADDVAHNLHGELASAMQALVAKTVDEVLVQRRNS